MKVGDKVSVIKKHDGAPEVGEEGKIYAIHPSAYTYPFDVEFDSGRYLFEEEELEIVEEIDQDPKQIEAEILDEIEEENFKRLAKKFLRLRKEISNGTTKVILQCDGEVLDEIGGFLCKIGEH